MELQRIGDEVLKHATELCAVATDDGQLGDLELPVEVLDGFVSEEATSASSTRVSTGSDAIAFAERAYTRIPSTRLGARAWVCCTRSSTPGSPSFCLARVADRGAAQPGRHDRLAQIVRRHLRVIAQLFLHPPLLGDVGHEVEHREQRFGLFHEQACVR
jgi:hypothetical protein